MPLIAGRRCGNLRRRSPSKPTNFFAPGPYTDGCPTGMGGGFLERIGVALALNFCVNALMLAATARMAGRWVPLWRLLLGALLGAVYAAGCMAFRFLGGLHWHLLSLGFMSALCFGFDWKLMGVFTVLTLSLGGAALAAGRGGLWQLPLYGVGVYLLGRFAFGPPGRRLLPVQIQGEGKRVCLTALLDTGNELHDPITGEPVLVIGREPAQELTGLTGEQLRHPLDTLAQWKKPGLRLIPYRAVGAENGLLLAMKFPVVQVGGRKGPGIVAFAAESFGKDYQGIAGGMY